MNGFSIYLTCILFIIAVFGFIYASSIYGGKNLIMIIISLELILLAIGLLFINLSFNFDDLIGYTFTLYLLPIAGAESAIALAFLVAYYPLRGNISF